MNKDFWKHLAEKWPIVVLAPMDGYCDSPYRQIVKKIAPHTVVFSEFYSADGLVHSKDLQRKALTHDTSEYPLIIQIFGKDPAMFREAAKIIEWYGITGIDINMGCPAKKVVKSGHGSSLMINRDTAFRIVEEMANAVKIPISVKTRLWWENSDLLVDFVKWLENAGANLISVHGRTYKQAFTGRADFTGIYNLKQHVNIPVVCNGDVMSYEDGIRKMVHPENRNLSDSVISTESPASVVATRAPAQMYAGMGQIPPSSEWQKKQNLDGFMIGRASFGNPWCFLPDNYEPTLGEILDTMSEHGKLLWQWKERKGMMEARKHLVQYLHGFPGVKDYRSRLVQVESVDMIEAVIQDIRSTHPSLLSEKMSSYNPESKDVDWSGCPVD
jgi:tRNA-dihydrouridine synthase B